MLDIALRRKLDRARTHWASLAAVEGLGWTVAVLAAAALLCFHLDWNVALTAEQRVACWVLEGVLLLGTVVLLVLRPGLRPRPDEVVAARVEQRFPELKERLLSTVEFGRIENPASRGLSNAMVHALGQETTQATRGLDFRDAFGLRGLRRSGIAAAVALGFVFLHVWALPNAMAAWFDRMAHPYGATPVWRDTRLQIRPLRGKVLKGGSFQVSVVQSGKHQREGRLRFQFGSGRWQQVSLRAGKDQELAHRFVGLTGPVRYYATAGDGLSDTGSVEVVDAPAILGAELEYRFPAYMERPVEKVTASSGGVAGPPGTVVHLRLRANKPLQRAEMSLPPQPPALWTPRGDSVAGSLMVKNDGSYRLTLRDTDGFSNPEPITFPIKSIPDQAPEVQVQDPVGDLEVVPTADVPLRLFSKDDYGIQLVRLRYRVNERNPALQDAGRGGRRDKIVEGPVTWHMAALKVRPGDVIRYQAEALDWDDISGPHVGRSPELQIRILDPAELIHRDEERRRELLEALQALIREQKAARAAVETERAAARPDAAKIADAEQRQRGLASQASELAGRVAELTRSAEMNHLANADELRAQQAAQQTLADLANTAMPKAANQIAEAQPNAAANPPQAKADLGKASEQQAEILRRLAEAAANLQPGSDLEQLGKRAAQLAGQQRDLAERAAKLLPQTLGKSMDELTPAQRRALSELAGAQQSLQRTTEQLTQDVSRAAESTTRSPAQQEAVRAAAQAMQEAGIPQKQSQAGQDVQRNALGQANSQQQQAAQDLQDLARALQQAATADDPRNLQKQLAAAQQQLRRMINEHQKAMEATRQNPNAQERQAIARTERDLQEKTQELQRQLQRLSRQAPSAQRAAQSMSQAGQSLGQASQSVSQNQTGQAQQQQRQALEAMQNAMQSLEDAMAEAGGENEDPFAELRKQLQELANQQRAVQATTRRIDGEVQKEGLQPDQKRELGQLASKQGELEGSGKELEKDLPGEVFQKFMQEARGQMTRAAQGLKQNNPAQRPTQRAQKSAIEILDQLVAALDPDPKDNDPSGGGGGGGGGGGQVDKELLKALAELRLLRLMEQGILERTRDTDDGRQANQPPTPEQDEEITGLAERQEMARRMAEQTAQRLKKYRQLAGKVTAAGGHMGEAKEGLDQKMTGDPTQEQEQQAIIKLTDALKATQKQAQSQRQSRGQQAGAQNRQQPVSQGGSTPGLSGRMGVRNTANETLGGAPDRDRGFGGLSVRDIDALRQGSREKSPAEFRDLINRYFKALSEQGVAGR